MTVFDYLALIPLTFAAVQDYRRRIIPDWTVGLVFLCAVLKLVIFPDNRLDALLSCLFFGTVTLILGSGGDGKLCAALGLLLGFADCLGVLILSLSGLIAYGLTQNAKSCPFAPYVLVAYLSLLILPTLLLRSCN